MKFSIYLFNIILLCSLSSFAQESQFTFNTLNESNGLVDNSVFCLLKDRQNILWIGTQNGLSRFDGSHFYNFKKNRDNNSLPHNSVESLCEDQHNNIWGGTDHGIFCYTPSQNKFQTYNAPSNCLSNRINNIIYIPDVGIFASTSRELLKFNESKNEFQKITQFHSNKDSILSYIVSKNGMLYDKENHGIWFASKGGLLYYDLSKRTLINHNKSKGISLFAYHNISALTSTPDHKIWFFDNTTNEIISFNPVLKIVDRQIKFKSEGDQFDVSKLLIDKHERAWLSNFAFNIYCIHLNNNEKIEAIYSKPELNTSIANDFFSDAFEDENGNIWFGTYKGISICNADKQLYKACNMPSKIPELKSTSIYFMKENVSDKSWWLSTGNHKLIHYYPVTQKYQIYDINKFKPNRKGLKPGFLHDLNFMQGNIVLNTATGTWQLKQGSISFEPSTLLQDMYDDFVFTEFIETDSMYYGHNNFKMIAINKFTKKEKFITHNTSKKINTSYAPFWHLLWKPNLPLYWTWNKDYISTQRKDGTIETIKIIKNNKIEEGGYIRAADIDHEGNIWVINYGVGLYKYNPTLKKINHWNDLDGLVNNNIQAVIADDKNYIWCTNLNKVSVFDKEENKFINFTIPSSENKPTYYNYLLKRSDGVIMGNVYNEIFEFYSENLKRSPIKVSPEFSSVVIAGKDYFPSKQKLVLKPEENSLRFKFGLLVDASTFPHTFEYYLEGLDHKWEEASSSNEATYNNLAYGEYTFHVIAKGRNNAWKSEEKIIKIKILTPFFKSKLFLGIIIVLISLGIFYLYRYRLLQSKKFFSLESKTQLLEKEKTIVMYESLKQQLNPHFLFNSLTSLSGLIETDQEMAVNFLEQMSGIYRYILKNGDAETVTLKDELEFVTLYNKLQQTRFRSGLVIRINIPEIHLSDRIAPVTLQNLIENAIKHNIIDVDTPLYIDIYIEDDYIVVKNNLQLKKIVESSNKKGLVQFKTLYTYLSEKSIIIENTDSFFIIKIPLL